MNNNDIMEDINKWTCKNELVIRKRIYSVYFDYFYFDSYRFNKTREDFDGNLEDFNKYQEDREEFSKLFHSKYRQSLKNL
jgi:hypothetical protein